MKNAQWEKENKARLKKIFIKELDTLAKKIGAPDGISNLPENILSFIYANKPGIPKLVCFNNEHKKSTEYIESKEVFIEILKREKFKFNDTLNASILDYITIFLALNALNVKLVGINFKKDEVLMSALDNFLNEYNNCTILFIEKLDVLCNIFNNFNSNISSKLVWLKCIVNEDLMANRGSFISFTYYEENVERREFKIDGNTRTAVKMYKHNFLDRPEEIQLNLSNLGFVGKEKATVYIQKHALIRIRERIDCLPLPLIKMSITLSMNNPRMERSSDGRVLIGLYYGALKLGYFTVIFIDGVLLITTFLFLTNDTTPEGTKLNELTGFKKTDKHYLQLDKLSSFANSDLEQDKGLLNIFEAAGCLHLFNDFLKQELEDAKSKQIAGFVRKYIS